ncbi:TonB-dependent receptor [Lysobacter helvus]|uniref:TonB-dependent receptor n=2 Tax=Lysobacteraceae TaxID=32033 RepID=A0ABM7Q253_9GAMM|nr:MULTISPECIES: TonB-dependent receptor [Lysobacter]BCT91333.1 TonB-dependent receptor [Lysobacter caseinilyticus]BCT94486.1 TonB-dependent receptor [Lysobacter helvus]
MGTSKHQRRAPARHAALRPLSKGTLAAAIYVAFQSMAFAQAAPQDPAQQQPAPAPTTQQRQATLDTVTVTALKREQDLQKVPISVQAVGEQELERHDVASFQDYAKLIPSVSFGTAGGGVFSGPGFLQVYMRGVASGGDGNHSGSQPSVGVYLDEQPITTITGALDVHMYDINRVEALPGPQGTLYGASSQAGTLRIITNKPDASAFAASAAAEVNVIENGGIGHVFEGMVNVPINDRTAVRIVGWNKHDAGYVDNVAGTRVFPTSGIVQNNDLLAKGNYNEANATGARVALKFDLNDAWSITPMIMGQKQTATGSTGWDPSVGEFKVNHAYPESSKDTWTQAALTIQGKIGNFDLTYAFGHLKRDVDSEADYSDYGFWYDTISGYGAYFYDDDFNLVNPSQYIQAKDAYTMTSHELRIASPAEDRLRFVGGVFWQEHKHDIEQRYRVDGLADSLSVQGWPDTIWLTEQDRNDKDEAVFGELTFDINDAWSVTAGGRWFRSTNGLQGYFGFADGYSSLESAQSNGVPPYGEAACRLQFGDNRANWPGYEGAPCSVFNKRVKESGSLGRFNVNWKLTDDALLYATYSEGYRPGGINRRGTLPPYLSDYLKNYEMGWKTSWLDKRLTFNGAVFRQDWDDFQYSYLGQNGLTEIRNAAKARIDGLEAELQWAVNYNFLLTGGFAYYDAKLTETYCGFTDLLGNPVTVCPAGTINPQTGEAVDGPQALSGARLPITARFKGNLTGRYTWDIGEYEAHVQGAVFHQGDRRTDLRDAESALLGTLDAYTTLDLSAGWRRGAWSMDIFIKNATNETTELSKFAECAVLTCGNQPYTVSTPPRTFGVRWSRDF